jgi:putative ABC transport system permease protein
VIPPVADRRARALALMVLGGGLALLAAWLAGSWWLGTIFVGGVAAALLVLSGASAAVLWLLRRLPRARSLSVRQGLGNLTRPGSQAAAVIVSLGLGVAVIAQIQLVQSGLLARVADDAPADAPNFFFIGVLPDQVEPFRALLREQGAARGCAWCRSCRPGWRGSPGARSRTCSSPASRTSARVTREFAITWQDEMPPGNEIVAGTWWTRGGGGARVAGVGVRRAWRATSNCRSATSWCSTSRACACRPGSRACARSTGGSCRPTSCSS